MIQRILVPLDGSPLAEDALAHATIVARSFGSKLLLLRVLQGERRAARTVDSAEWRLRKSEALAYFQALVATLHARGLEADAEIAEGRSAAEEVVARARQREADLIVLRDRGRSGLEEFGFGGTAAKIAAHAGTSLLVVRTAVEGAGAEPRYERIVVAVDTSQRCDWAVSLAAALARGSGTELVLAHVVPPTPLPQRKPPAPREARLIEKLSELNRGAAREYLQETQDKLGGPDLRVRAELLESRHVAQAIEELAASERASLVVVGAHGASGPAPWPFGSVAATLVAYGRTSLLVFQDMPHGIVRDGEPVLGSAAHTGNGWPR